MILACKIGPRIAVIRRHFATTRSMRDKCSSYVNKMRLFEYWQQSDNALDAEFPNATAILMVDKEPLVQLENNEMHLVRFETSDLRARLNQYGLEIGILNSCLLDVVEPASPGKDFRPLFGTAIRTMEPPDDSGIDGKELKKQLANSLGGKFRDLRMSMLTLTDDNDRTLLARFQSLIRWSLIYKRCPTCTSVLRMRASKYSAKCIRCQRDFYPHINPVAICIIHDETNQHCLLVRHLGSLLSIFTCVAGYGIPGESIQETVKREVAEEVGIECKDVQMFNMSQSWPPSSLMLAFRAVANTKEPINISPGELAAARWCTREEVREALERTNADPFLRGAIKLNQDLKTATSVLDSQKFLYVPPHGAIAHQIIRNWLKETD